MVWRVDVAKFRLLAKKECWALTGYGWIILVLGSLLFLYLITTNLYDFLAVTQPVKSDVMVVNGWLPDYTLKAVTEEFKTNDYKLLIITGGPILKGSYLVKYRTFADLAAETLIKIGFDKEKMVLVPAPKSLKDRTYKSALVIKEYFDKNDKTPETMNLYSYGPHSRRSWLLYKNVFKNQVEIGIIAGKCRNFDESKWWSSSNGFRAVIDEFIAFVYARFFFHP